MELYSTVGGVDAYGYIDNFIVYDELQLVLAGIAFEEAFCEDGLKGRAFEGLVTVADHHYVVAAGRRGLPRPESTPYILIL